MNDPLPPTYFVDGGTLRANTPSYVKRPADDELFNALMDSEFCYILTPRQMGKSSLMIRTSQRLKEKNVKTATVDIQGIGTDKIREWYASLLSQIRRGLRLSVDIDDWMTKKSNVGFGQMFSDFIQDVVLTEIADPVVIFLDEVDWMIKIDFRDDFFASIRAMYNARAQYSEFNRISFVLLGVASPADLISEPTRTPFNIGHAIPLQELSLVDATPLQTGLEQVCPGLGQQILQRIFYWTNGHPYLTQKICKTIAETGKADWSNIEVDELVHLLFLAEEARKEANLKFIQDRILGNDQNGQLLKLYKRARRTKIKESGQSIIQNQLKLSGLLTSRDGYLEVRNRIYRSVFNDRWINQNTPRNWQRIALISLSFLLVALLAVIGYNATVTVRLKTYQADYINADSNAQKITALANIYGLRYLFSSNTPVDMKAAETFYDFTSNRNVQLSLFPPYGYSNPVSQNDLLRVIDKLYVTLADVDEENDNTTLLQAMYYALGDETGNNLRTELDNWIIGRTNYRKGIYDLALQGYNAAISLNPRNQATLYERAKVYVALRQFENAVRDLDSAISAANQSAPDIPPSPIPTTTLLPQSETPSIPTVQAVNTSPENSTIVPSEISELQTLTITSTSETIIPSSSLPGYNKSDKFELKFTTLDHVITAIRVLIEQTSGLQTAIQPNKEGTYTNLQVAGLVKNYPTATPTSFSELSCDRVQFTADVTVPDGTRFAPGTSFEKTWRLKNVGSCEWTTSYQLVFIEGERMGAPLSVEFPENVAAGDTVDISVIMKAPNNPGVYRGYWMLKNENGELFGVGSQGNRTWWVEINVISTSVTQIAYDFNANASAATWSSGAGELSFPGADGDEKGFALKLEQPHVESGVVASLPGMLVSPQQVTNGFIQAQYPAFAVQGGDRFQATTGCQAGADSCYVAYRLDYVLERTIKTFWVFRERFDGTTHNVNLDLSSLAGKEVKFILYLNAYGSPVDDRALWGNPVIVRPEASSSPSTITPGGPTITPAPNLAYDFATNVCAGSWFSGAGELPCPGTDGDADGFVLKISNPKLESGDMDTQPGVITFPQNTQNGYVQGFFPAFKVQSGDRFRSIVNCEGGATNCYVAFRLDYQTGTDPIRTFWGPFAERYDGRPYSVDVDLSSLAGKDVKFILTVLAAGTATGDRALWVGPHIYRPGTSSSPATPTPR
jgi:tetratricopeptide (TPR) repeat protein